MGIRVSLWRMGAISTGAALTIFSVAFADNASAATFNYTFTQTEVGSFSAPYGTVQVVENAGNLDFTVTLDSAYRFRENPDKNHHAFSFNVDTAVNILSLTAGFVHPGSGLNQSPFGSFTNTIDWTNDAKGGGWGVGSPGPLTFTLDAVNALTNLTIANLSPNVWETLNIWFAADLVNEAGATGNVGATFTSKGGGNSPVPLPGALVLFGSVIAGAVTAANIRRRRQRA